jgi:hypothetical protein
MAMLLLGFGYLMTFLKKYGLGAVGMTMMLSVLAMELNCMVEWLVRILYGEVEMPLPISLATLIDGEFAAATLMITFGALIGRASPLQMLIICCSQSFFYAFNKVVLVLGLIQAEDVGGSMTIHSKLCRQRLYSPLLFSFLTPEQCLVRTLASRQATLLEDQRILVRATIVYLIKFRTSWP